MTSLKGKLFLIPLVIGETEINRTIPSYNLNIINQINTFIVENISTARRFLRKCGYDKDFKDVTFYILDKHTAVEDSEKFLSDCLAGKNTGLMSESGSPCIADPGNTIVSMAHRIEIQVIPLTGPSSIILALMASGFNGQNFTFNGYLPVEQVSLGKKLRELERNSLTNNQTQIFIEAPYRNNRMLSTIIKECKPSTLLCIACELTTENESVVTQSIQNWKNTQTDYNKKNCVFLIYT